MRHSQTPPRPIETLERRQMLAAAPVVGVGVLGDSYADEHQFADDDRVVARNFVEQLAEDRGLNFGAFSAEPRPEPRGAGFEFNWAQSGATSTDMIATGQHTGLAAQAAAGAVTHVMIFIGGNDFGALLGAPDPITAATQLPTIAQTVVSNITTAVETLLAADPDVRVAVATLPNFASLPDTRNLVQLGQVPQLLVDAVDSAVGGMNDQIRALAKASPRVAVADVDAEVRKMARKRRFKIGRVEIDRFTASNEPNHAFLADGIHAGTAVHGVLANTFVKAMNKEFKARVKPLKAREILENAGL